MLMTLLVLLRARIPGSWRITSSLRTMRRLTGTVDIDSVLMPPTGPHSTAVPGRPESVQAIVFVSASPQDVSAASRDEFVQIHPRE